MKDVEYEMTKCKVCEKEMYTGHAICLMCSLKGDTMESLKEEILTTLNHAQFFIGSRQKMHPAGRELYQELIDKIQAI